LRGLFAVRVARAELDKAGELAAEMLRLAGETRDQAHLWMAHEHMGETLYWRGEFRRAREHQQEVIRRYDSQEYWRLEHTEASGNPGVLTLCYLSWTLWLLGYPDQALTRSREGLALAQEFSGTYDEAFALGWGCAVLGMRGEWQAVLEQAEALIALSSEHGFPVFLGFGTFMRAAALANQGEVQEGIATMCAGREAMRHTGTALGAPQMLSLLAEAHGKAGQIEESLAVVAEALELAKKTGERAWEAEVHRLKGELLLARSPSDQAGAEASFRQALDVARHQSAKSWELGAATSLARLWQQQGRTDEARELLAPVYSWFTEGFDTRDLKEAKALVEELESGGQMP
jgi:predicted ATPase